MTAHESSNTAVDGDIEKGSAASRTIQHDVASALETMMIADERSGVLIVAISFSQMFPRHQPTETGD